MGYRHVGGWTILLLLPTAMDFFYTIQNARYSAHTHKRKKNVCCPLFSLSFWNRIQTCRPPLYSQRKTTLGLVSYRNRIQSVCLPYNVCEKSNKWFKPFLYIPNQSTHIQNSDSPSRYFTFFLVVSLEQDQENIKNKEERERWPPKGNQ